MTICHEGDLTWETVHREERGAETVPTCLMPYCPGAAAIVATGETADASLRYSQEGFLSIRVEPRVNARPFPGWVFLFLKTKRRLFKWTRSNSH